MAYIRRGKNGTVNESFATEQYSEPPCEFLPDDDPEVVAFLASLAAKFEDAEKRTLALRNLERERLDAALKTRSLDELANLYPAGK